MTQSQPAETRSKKSTQPTSGRARLSTVVASMPGIAEQSLKATLESLSSVRVVGTASGCLSAFHMVRDNQVDLVVLDSNLPLDDVRVFLQQLRSAGLATRSLVLAATSGQVRHALAAGADAALRRDSSIGQLSATVDGFRSASMEAGPEPHYDGHR